MTRIQSFLSSLWEKVFGKKEGIPGPSVELSEEIKRYTRQEIRASLSSRLRVLERNAHELQELIAKLKKQKKRHSHLVERLQRYRTEQLEIEGRLGR